MSNMTSHATPLKTNHEHSSSQTNSCVLVTQHMRKNADWSVCISCPSNNVWCNSLSQTWHCLVCVISCAAPNWFKLCSSAVHNSLVRSSTRVEQYLDMPDRHYTNHCTLSSSTTRCSATVKPKSMFASVTKSSRSSTNWNLLNSSG